jgi:hypothetical protein
MSDIQAEEIVEALEPIEEPKKRTAKKAAPKPASSTERARAIVLERLKNR